MCGNRSRHLLDHPSITDCCQLFNKRLFGIHGIPESAASVMEQAGELTFGSDPEEKEKK